MANWSEGTPDEELVELCRAGHLQAFSVLVERHKRKVFQVVYRVLGNEAASDDICQEAFITAYQKLDLFHGRCKFSTWVCQIALNKGRDALRGVEQRTVHEDIAEVAQFLPASPDDEPSRRLEADQEARLMQSLLDRLPPAYREVLVLKHIEEYSYEEMAIMLETSVTNVKTRTFRAREAFRNLLEGCHEQAA